MLNHVSNSTHSHTLQPYYNTVVCSTNSVITRLRLASLCLCLYFLYKTLLMIIFCYNVDSPVDPKISVIMRFQCTGMSSSISSSVVLIFQQLLAGKELMDRNQKITTSCVCIVKLRFNFFNDLTSHSPVNRVTFNLFILLNYLGLEPVHRGQKCRNHYLFWHINLANTF